MMIMIHRFIRARKLLLSVAVTLLWMQPEQLFVSAQSTYIVYRRSEKELPARVEEVHHAKEEGIQFHLLTQPEGNSCG